MSMPRKEKSPTAAQPVDLRDSYAWCKSLSKRTAGNFYYSFLTLSSDHLRDMCVLYAFMRVSDDLGDAPNTPAPERAARLAQWRESLDRALAGEPHDHPLLPALAEVIDRYDIPTEYLHAVIDGVAMDLEPAGFETFDELARYCYQVAGAVGLCCIHIWGYRDERAPERAVDCGLAFQLTNILRDLREDAEMGRVYLPREDLRRFGYTREDIVARRRGDSFVRLMKFQVERARRYYRRAEELFDYLEPAGRPIYRAMLRIYGGLLDRIEGRNYDVYSRRVRLPRWRKLVISADAILRKRWLGRSTAGR